MMRPGMEIYLIRGEKRHRAFVLSNWVSAAVLVLREDGSFRMLGKEEVGEWEPRGSELKEIQELCYRGAEQAGFHADLAEGVTRAALVNRLALLHSEVSEVYGELRAGRQEELLVELADVLIVALDLAGILEADMEPIILEKLRHNRSRGIRHGKEF